MTVGVGASNTIPTHINLQIEVKYYIFLLTKSKIVMSHHVADGQARHFSFGTLIVHTTKYKL